MKFVDKDGLIRIFDDNNVLRLELRYSYVWSDYRVLHSDIKNPTVVRFNKKGKEQKRFYYAMGKKRNVEEMVKTAIDEMINE